MNRTGDTELGGAFIMVVRLRKVNRNSLPEFVRRAEILICRTVAGGGGAIESHYGLRVIGRAQIAFTIKGANIELGRMASS